MTHRLDLAYTVQPLQVIAARYYQFIVSYAFIVASSVLDGRSENNLPHCECTQVERTVGSKHRSVMKTNICVPLPVRRNFF